MTLNLPRGIETSSAFRLCSRALTMRMLSSSGRRMRAGLSAYCSGRPSSTAWPSKPSATSYSRSAFAVCELAWRLTSSGVPQATTSPPASPPSGPRSISQSDERTTSRLCSMTMIECPASRSLRNDRISLAMSSKCSPVVGSSNMKSVPLRATRLAAERGALRRFGEKAGQLQALRFAARERRHRLAELDVFEADVDDRLQAPHHFAVVAEQRHGFGDGELEHVGDAQAAQHVTRQPAVDLHVEDLAAEAPPVAVRATQVHVGEELHLDVLEAGAAAGRAAAVAGVEAEHAGAVAALQGERLDREELADLVERADVARRVRARRLADRALVDEDRVGQPVGAEQRFVRARRFGGLAEVARQRRRQHVLDQRALARARDAGDADQVQQRELDRDVLQVVVARALQDEACGVDSPTRRFRPMPICLRAPR